MAITVGQLANLVGGIVRGDANLVVRSPRTLHEAQPGDITFLDNPRHYVKLEQSAASAAIVPPNMPPIARTVIEVADPLLAFVSVVQFFKGKPPRPSGIDSHACIHASAVLGADVAVGPFASIGEHAVLGARCQLHAGVRVGANCKLGDDVVLHPNVVLYEDTVLGNRVVIHANTSIGGDGFGYRFQQGRHVKVPQLGNVVIGDDVEIGAGSTIDRGTFGSTVIGEGTKIDNLVQVAHNTRIGKHNLLAALVGVAGSCTTGDYVMMGGQSGVKDHVHIGAGARIGAKTGIIADVPAGRGMFLYPAYEEHEAARILACMTRLPGMRKDLLRVLKHLKMDKHSEAATTRDPEAPAA